MRFRLPRNHIARPRLDAALSSVSGVGVLEGCRGSGKTTALRAWLATIPHSVFVDDAGAPGAWNSLLHTMESGPAARVAGIDQFERAPDGMAEAILSLVAGNPGLRVIVAGRSAGHFGNRLLRVRHGVVRLGPHDLSLEDEEIEQLLGVRPAPAELEMLRLPLVCVATAVFAAEEGKSLASATRAAASAALAEALEGTDPLIDDAIRLLAVPKSISEGTPLPGFTPADHRALLAELARRGLGVCADGEFAFAPSWRAALSEEFRESSPVSFRFAHARIAAGIHDPEHAIDALEHWIEAANFDRAALTAREYWREISALRPAEALSVLERADRATFGRTATLCALMAECATELGDHQRAETWWRAALAGSPAAEGSLARRGLSSERASRAWDAFIRARALRGIGLYEQAATAADEGVGILAPNRLLPPRTNIVGLMLAEFALAFLSVGQLDRGRALLADASALAPRGSSGWFAGRAIGVAIEALCGNRVEAERILREVDRLLVEPGLNRSILGSWVALGRAVIAADRGLADEARHQVAHARGRASRDLLRLIDLAECYIELTHGLTDAALAIASEVWRDAATPPAYRDWAEWLRASSLVRLGRGRSVITEARDLPSLAMSSRIIRASGHMLADDAHSAFVLLAPLLTQPSPDMPERFLAVAHGMLLIAALRVGDTPTAREALRRLSSLNESSGTALPVHLVPQASLGLVESTLPGAHDLLTAMVPPGATPASALPLRPVLSAAQQRVLSVLADESSLSSIADKLSLSRNTVKTHLRSVYRALGAEGRDDALVKATRAGYLERR